MGATYGSAAVFKSCVGPARLPAARPCLLRRHGGCHSFTAPPPKRNAGTHSGRRRAQEVRAPVPILKDAVPGDMEAGRGAART